MSAVSAVQDLYDAGPGGICADCGHFAYRHVGRQCRWPDRQCCCEGMLWQGERIEMNGTYGPVMEQIK